MITSKDCFARFGDPWANEAKFMTLWDVPPILEVGVIPKGIYCNRIMIYPLTRAFNNVISRGLVREIKTWDGCFNRRQKRGGTTLSLHSWGIAIDINAAWNPFGKVGNISPELVKCFTDAGFDWGGTWKKPDMMHFQLKELTIV